MSGPCRLESKRLILRPLELADAEQTQILFPHWEIVRYLSKVVPWPYPADGAHRYYHEVALPAMSRGEQWHWTLRLKSDPDRLIGSISLMTGNDNRGFWIAKDWQGQGLMSEAAERATDYWFNTLGFPVLRTPKAIENEPSRRISCKSRMRVVRTEKRNYVGGRFLTEIWEITREEWNARHAHETSGAATL
jgi:ribosomal-protein-alanine N-acetyltransferase